MKYSSQSDKNVRIFNKVKIFTNIKFKPDLGIELTNLNISKRHKYIFSSYYLNFQNDDLSSFILDKINQDFYVIILILKNEEKSSIKYFQFIENIALILGKKLIFISDFNIKLKFKEKNFLYNKLVRKFKSSNIKQIISKNLKKI